MKRDSHIDSPKWNEMRRAQIATQNQLADAVRTMHNLYCPCPEHVKLRKREENSK